MLLITGSLLLSLLRRRNIHKFLDKKIKLRKHIIYDTTQSTLEKNNWEPWDKIFLGDKEVVFNKACCISASSKFSSLSSNKLQLMAFSWVNEGKLDVPLSLEIKEIMSSPQKTPSSFSVKVIVRLIEVP